MALGAAVGEAALGKQVGNKAVLWGAACGLLPDLDVLAGPFLTDVEKLTFHRGFSHSIVFAILVAPLLAWLVAKIHGRKDANWRDWTKLTFLSIATHPLLDCFTNYGTQLFQPFSNYPVALNTIFIVDPLYTLPLLIGAIAAMFCRRASNRRQLINYLGLGLSSFYLLVTAVNKLYINSVFEAALEKQQIGYQRYFTNPMPLNNILWRGVVETEKGFLEGLYSLLDRDEQVAFRFIEKNHQFIRPFNEHREIEQLVWFSRGYFCISQRDSLLYFNDLRFGKTDLGILPFGEFIFSYRIARAESDPNKIAVSRVSPNIRISQELFGILLRRAKGNSK
jgi:inner membrane protein